MPGLKLGSKEIERLREASVQAYPDEACGVILSLPDGGLEVRPMRNIQNEMHEKLPEYYPRTAAIAYEWDLREREEMEAQAAKPGYALAAIYHSHPDHGAYFSDTDQAAATPFGEPTYPGAVQIVVSVLEGKADEIKVFDWSEQAGRYVEVPLERAD